MGVRFGKLTMFKGSGKIVAPLFISPNFQGRVTPKVTYTPYSYIYIGNGRYGVTMHRLRGLTALFGNGIDELH